MREQQEDGAVDAVPELATEQAAEIATSAVVEVAVEDVVVDAPSGIDSAIDAWFAKHFHGLGAMLDDRVYAIAHAAKDDLKKILSAL